MVNPLTSELNMPIRCTLPDDVCEPCVDIGKLYGLVFAVTKL
jgi:hypothetical protein